MKAGAAEVACTGNSLTVKSASFDNASPVDPAEASIRSNETKQQVKELEGMKRVLAVSIVVFLAGLISAHATTNTFEVDVSGVIKGSDGSSVKVENSELLTNSADELAVVFDTVRNYWELDEVNPASSNSIVRFITGVDSMAQGSKGAFLCDLYTGDGTTFSGGVPPIGGDIFVSGKLSTTGKKPSFSAKLDGVWKDPTYRPTNSIAYEVKGAIKSSGTLTTPPNY
jgi:hypothetical protein